MGDETASGGELLSKTGNLLRDNSKGAWRAFLIVAAVGCGIDFLSRSGSNSPAVLSTAVSIYFQYETTYRLLSELGLLPDGYRARRFWSVLGLSIVTGIGLIAGLVLLVVPAVILSVRWFVSVPALIGEEVGVFAALGRSWEETKGRFWPIFIVLIAVYALMIPGMALLALNEITPNFGVLDILANALIAACSVAGWHAAVAVYADRLGKSTLAEVFS